MIVCNKCGKSLDSTSFHSNGRGGLRKTCKICVNNQCKEYRESNHDKVKLKNEKYRKNNKELLRLKSKRHYALNKHMYAEAEARRRSLKQKATPRWLSVSQRKEIRSLYWLAQDLAKVTGEVYHVDHVVPLKHEKVCGLHVPWNLQILPKDLNYAKSNNFVNDSWAT